MMELLVGQAEPGDEGAKVENSSLRDTRGDCDRRLTEDVQHRWCIELADAVLPEQPGQRRLAQARRLGRGWSQCPQGGTVNLIGSGRDKAGESGHTNAYGTPMPE